jgi:tetratricopeptide (TPR) repeat protein
MAQERNGGGKTIEGVFSSREPVTGSKTYWLVKEIPGGRAEIQPVNERLVPQGQKKNITLGQLLESYEPEPDFYTAKSYKESKAQGRETKATPAENKGGVKRDLEGFDLFGSPEEVEKNARAGFGMGLAHLKRGNAERAKEIFERIAEDDADYAPEHKHMFNDFGITLRQQHFAETSVKNYTRALSLVQGDENLHFNIARAYYELQEFDKAVEHLERALEIEPGLMEARMFIEYIRRKRRKTASRVSLDM